MVIGDRRTLNLDAPSAGVCSKSAYQALKLLHSDRDVSLSLSPTITSTRLSGEA